MAAIDRDGRLSYPSIGLVPAEGFVMDWIERVFHLSPDGGSGTTEMAVFAAVAAVTLLGRRLPGRLVRALRPTPKRDRPKRRLR